MHKWLYLFIFLFFTAISHAEQLIIEPDMGRAPILSAIKQAKKSIDVVMYGFTDSQFIQALIDAKKSDKSVAVLLQKYPYKNTDENTNAIAQLTQQNINLKWSNPEFKLTHQKTFIFDNHDVLIMTFNLTDSTFTHERNFALFIDDPTTVNEIRRVFQADWKYQPASVQQADLVWSPNNSREKLLGLIQQAHSSIEIYAQDITDYKTIGELGRAARRGITVDIITSEKTKHKPNRKLAYLTRAGVRLHFSKKYYIHAKVIIIDHHAALLGSMNLTAPSIEDNRELSIVTRNPTTIRKLEETFKHDWND